jgi:OOP family OmpA-OmpF porin
MYKIFFTALLALVGCSALQAQTIQWNHLLLPGEVNVVAKDSSEKSMVIFRSRLFLYDSLHSVSKASGIPFFEYDYIAEFKRPQEASHIIINFTGASRLMYYIRLHDEQGGTHVVYNYGAIRACDPEIQTLLLTVAPTPYKVKKVEIGTFKGEHDILKVGLSNEPDGNKVVQELVAQRYKSICNKASYFTDKIVLNNGVNSSSYEVKPVISSDGKTLFFHRQNYKENSGGKKDDQDIYVSRFVNNDWAPAENMKSPLNDNMPNGIASVSSGETSLFLINEYLAPNQQRQGLSVSQKTINGWSFPKKIEVKNFYNRSPYIDYFISPTQNEMILAVQRDDSYGDQDLYVSFFDDATGSWTEPLNLGAEVNSMISETSPFLAADGKTLYFASDGFLGYGGFDIYVTHRLDDSWTNWSFPENLGPVVNSFDDDLYYTVSAAGDQAYFVSTVNKDRNIFRIALPAIYKPEPVVLLAGRIFDSSTATPLEAEIKISWHNDSEIIGSGKSDPITGEYKLILPSGGIYDYRVTRDGFTHAAGTISTLKTRAYEEKEQNIKIRQTIASPASTTNITMQDNESREQWKSKIENVATYVKAFPGYTITVAGTIPDSITSSGYKSLEEIKTQLIRSGVSRENITVVTSSGRPVTIQIAGDSVMYDNETVVIPENYSRPEKNETSDIAVLVKGKVIDATNFKPVASRLIFKINDKVKSRSSSDPATGNYQTLVPSNTQYAITIYKDSVEETLTYHSPEVKQYEEVGFICVLNKEKAKQTSFEIGSGISSNKDEAAQARETRFIKKKKATKQILNLKNNNEPIAPRVQNDLLYLAELLKNIPDLRANLVIHTSSSLKDQNQFQDSVAKRCSDFFLEKGVDPTRVAITKAGSTVPKNPKIKHHSNTRIEAELSFPK